MKKNRFHNSVELDRLIKYTKPARKLQNMRTLRDVYGRMSFQQDLFILPCHVCPLACCAPDGRRVRAVAPGNIDRGQQPMQSPFPGRPVAMAGRRFIGSGRQTRQFCLFLGLQPVIFNDIFHGAGISY
ncbi:hypothetical protein [Desulfosarcina alkanivorans]|uniref:hypothetical protein n=1 Tax=Desulfosarcina alkanivorans TaxID=571177 RepID=UPI0012D363B7|nr:hypothetical protein [Desulfosarcina alkanivorans]